MKGNKRNTTVRSFINPVVLILTLITCQTKNLKLFQTALIRGSNVSGGGMVKTNTTSSFHMRIGNNITFKAQEVFDNSSCNKNSLF